MLTGLSPREANGSGMSNDGDADPVGSTTSLAAVCSCMARQFKAWQRAGSMANLNSYVRERTERPIFPTGCSRALMIHRPFDRRRQPVADASVALSFPRRRNGERGLPVSGRGDL